MNANELADELHSAYCRNIEIECSFEESIYGEAATMLRQQQAEIEALKHDNEELLKSLIAERTPKQLSDEEAYSVFESEAMKDGSYDWKAGVRAILKKASEK